MSRHSSEKQNKKRTFFKKIKKKTLKTLKHCTPSSMPMLRHKYFRELLNG